MPIHVGGLPRRTFLKTSLGATASLLTFRSGFADDTSGPTATSNPTEHVTLLSDPHIAADITMSARGSFMASNLLRVVADILAQPTKPSFALINGDCAFNVGLPEDYATFASLVATFPTARIPLHMTMGNHDDRIAFLKQFPQTQGKVEGQTHAAAVAVEGRYVSLVETKYANWFLIDTLQKVNHVTGEMGPQQLEWLRQALMTNSDKPAIVVGHHNPQFNVPEDGRVTGLQDSSALFELLESQPHVKAYVYGHTHAWSTTRRDSGLHLINLPPIGYVFNESSPLGWVDAELSAAGLQLTLHSLNADHAEHLKIRSLKWS